MDKEYFEFNKKKKALIFFLTLVIVYLVYTTIKGQ